MKKGLIRILSLVIIVALGFYIFIFREDYAENKIEVEQELVMAIQKKRQTNDRVLIDFKHVAPFDWNKVYIFTPYTSSEIINEQLGFEWNNSEVGVIEYQEHLDLIVFVKDNIVIGYVEHERANGFEIKTKMGFSSNEAIFEFVKGHYAEPNWFTIRHIE